MSQMMGTPDVKTYISYTDKVLPLNSLFRTLFDSFSNRQAVSAKTIDNTANLADDKVFLFSGSVDSTVKVRMCSQPQVFKNTHNFSLSSPS